MFALCDKFIQKNKLKPHRKVFSNYTFSCFDEIANVPQSEWNEATDPHNIFLSYVYLNVIHQHESDTFRFRYVIVYNRKKPIGVVYFQINDSERKLYRGPIILNEKGKFHLSVVAMDWVEHERKITFPFEVE